MFNFKLIVMPLMVAFLHLVDSSAVPFINKCKLSDPKCLKESTQKAITTFAAGLPNMGIETLEPIHMDKIDSSSPSLSLVLKDITGTGLSQCVAKKVKFIENLKIIVKLMCTVDLNSQYQIDGNVLILHIEGKGKAHFVLRKVLITVEAQLEEVTGSDGVRHWSIKDWNHVYELKERATIELENLFNGNAVLAQAANEFIRSSSNEIITEIGPPIIKKVIFKIIKNVGKFFAFVPLDDLVQKE